MTMVPFTAKLLRLTGISTVISFSIALIVPHTLLRRTPMPREISFSARNKLNHHNTLLALVPDISSSVDGNSAETEKPQKLKSCNEQIDEEIGFVSRTTSTFRMLSFYIALSFPNLPISSHSRIFFTSTFMREIEKTWEVYVSQPTTKTKEKGVISSTSIIEAFLSLSPSPKAIKVYSAIWNKQNKPKGKGHFVRCVKRNNEKLDRGGNIVAAVEISNVDSVDKVYRIITEHMKLGVSSEQSFNTTMYQSALFSWFMVSWIARR